MEPDEDVWRAYVPDLESRGAATWGQTREEALRNIQEVAQMVIEELVEEQGPSNWNASEHRRGPGPLERA